MKYQKEIQKRRTFAIISHPDAGKTTLTEKLLLFGGAIQVAGAVKSNKIKKHATSDFMEIERQRGISVATSVMTFNYNGQKINILDTIYSEDFTSLAAGCVCPTCQQGFTKAYLHHLLQNTPLLAQRFLIAHNISIMRQTFCLT